MICLRRKCRLERKIRRLLTLYEEELIMSQLTDASNAAAQNVLAKLTAGSLTSDQVNAQIHTITDPIQAEVDDVKAGLEVYNTVLAPATSS